MVTGELRPSGAAARIDFFISYAEPDEDWASWIAAILEAAGRSVRLQAWDLAAGQNSVVWTSQQMDNAGGTIALYSPAYFAAQERNPEWAGALAAHRLIPLRVAECQLPGILETTSYRDLHNVNERVAHSRVQEAAGLATPDRQSSGFPGGTSGPAGAGSRVAFPGRLPQIFTAPTRLRYFTGRTDLLDQLYAGLTSGGPSAVTALHGLGGVGKTQLAVEYAHRHAADYQAVIWVDAETTERIPAQLAQIAGHLGLAATGQVDTDAQLVRDTLRRRDGWLLVYDNAENPAALRPWLTDGAGHVLITSRHTGWGALAEPIEIDVMTRADATALLARRIPGLDPDIGEALADELGDLPLGLEQAAAHIDVTRIPAAEYLTRFRAQRAGMLAEGVDLAHGGRIATLWKVTLDRLNPAGIRLLELCAYLGPEPISLDLLSQTSRRRWRTRDRRAMTVGDRQDAINTAVAYSLVHRSGDSLTMHRLLAAAIRAHQRPQARAATAAAARALLVAARPKEHESPNSWPAWGALIPAILTAPALHPDEGEPLLRPRVRRLLIDAVHYLTARGDYRAAAALGATVHARLTTALGADHPDSLAAANAVALPLKYLGDIKAAYALDLDTFTRRQRTLGHGDRDTLGSAGNLADDLRELGNYQAARDLDEDILNRMRRPGRFGADPSDALGAANNVAIDLTNLGEHETARALNEDTLTRCRQLLGEDDPQTLRAANNLAENLRELGAHQEAHDRDEDTLTRRRRVLGYEHPHTLRSVANLADDLRHLGEPHRARDLLEDTLVRRRRILGRDHPETLECANNLAALLRELGDHQSARSLDEDTLTRYRRLPRFGPDHPQTLESAHNLAADLRALADYQSARDLDEDTYARRQRLAVEKAQEYERQRGRPAYVKLVTDALTSAHSLAADLRELEDFQGARTVDELTLSQRRLVLGNDHPDTLMSARCLAIDLRALGEREKAAAVEAEYRREPTGQTDPK